MRPPKDHRPGCPRLQFWDAGEWQAPCLCDEEPLAPPWRSPLFWVAVAFLAGALIALFFWVTPAQAQELEPGVGLELPAGTPMCWELGDSPGTFPLNPMVRPWGPDGNGALNVPLKWARYHGGTSTGSSIPCGQAAEAFEPANSLALMHAFEGRCSGLDHLLHRQGRDGIPTTEEKWDLALSTPRCGQSYRRCWHELKAGGTPESAIPVSTPFQWRLFSAQLPEEDLPCELGEVVALRGAMCDWPVYRVVEYLPEERPWCEGSGPPPPPPPPPPPEPEPEPEPEGDLPECSPACSQLAKSVDQALRTQRRSILPDGRGEIDAEGRWQFVADWMRNRLESLAVHCWHDLAEGCYVPGLPSTGRVELELELESEVER